MEFADSEKTSPGKLNVFFRDARFGILNVFFRRRMQNLWPYQFFLQKLEKKSKFIFQNEESRKIKKIQKNLKTPKKTQKCITKKIVDFFFTFFIFLEFF